VRKQIWFGLSLILAGCVTPEAQFAPAQRDSMYPVRTPPGQIELYRSQSPTKKFTELGAVNACCSHDSNVLIELLKRKAADVGGDALIGIDIDATGNATASVIRFE